MFNLSRHEVVRRWIMIRNNVYFDGKVQSLGFTAPCGVPATVGVMEPGEYKFPNEKEEHITVVMGKMEINGTLYFQWESCVVPANAGVHVVVLNHNAAYLCSYHEPSAS